MSRRIFAVDPGPSESAWVLLVAPEGDGLPRLEEFAISPNGEILHLIGLHRTLHKPEYVFERIASYGMPVGEETFETVYWTGRFVEACRDYPVTRIKRKEVVLNLCQSPRGNDATVRQALIDRWGGKKATRKGGLLHGVKADIWAALAVGVTYLDIGGGA